MVKLEIINDDAPQQEPVYEQKPDIESDSEYDDDEFDLNETLLDRVVALQDIIPPHLRASVSNTVGNAYSFAGSALSLGGSGLWIATSAMLLFGIPFGLCLAGEEQLNELENNLSGSQIGGADNMLAPEGETKA